MPASLSIYNACILFCDCLKITKQITQKHTNTRNTSIIFMTAITKNRTIFSHLKNKKIKKQKNKQKQIKKEIKNMISGWQLLFLPKYHCTFLCWFVFLVFNTLQQKTRNIISFSPQKVIIIILIIIIMFILIITVTGARSVVTHCGVPSDDPPSRNALNSCFWVTRFQAVYRLRKFVEINNCNVCHFLVHFS